VSQPTDVPVFPDLAPYSVRDLIAELARLEDALRDEHASAQARECAARLSGDLFRLLTRQRQIVKELRRRQHHWKAITSSTPA
jgi:hypothetical protein